MTWIFLVTLLILLSTPSNCIYQPLYIWLPRPIFTKKWPSLYFSGIYQAVFASGDLQYSTMSLYTVYCNYSSRRQVKTCDMDLEQFNNRIRNGSDGMWGYFTGTVSITMSCVLLFFESEANWYPRAKTLFCPPVTRVPPYYSSRKN